MLSQTVYHCRLCLELANRSCWLIWLPYSGHSSITSVFSLLTQKKLSQKALQEAAMQSTDLGGDQGRHLRARFQMYASEALGGAGDVQ